MTEEHDEYERLVESLNDAATLAAYAAQYAGYRVSLLPRVLGGFLIWSGNVVYGRTPSYQKFRAIGVYQEEQREALQKIYAKNEKKRSRKKLASAK